MKKILALSFLIAAPAFASGTTPCTTTAFAGGETVTSAFLNNCTWLGEAFTAEGTTADANETVVGFTDATADVTLNFPALSAGTFTIATIDGSQTFANGNSYTTPNLLGKIDANNSAVDDDDCTGEQGKFWYDTTDSAIEFCNANAGAPATVAATAGDITKVGTDCTTGDCFVTGGTGTTLESDTDLVAALDANNDSTSKFSITNGADTEVAQINESGTLQIDDVLTSDGVGTSDFDGPVTAPSFTADPSATPSVGMQDSDMGGTPDTNAQILVNCPTGSTVGGDEDCDMDLKVQAAGTLTTAVRIDTTDAGVISVVGVDGVMLDYSGSNASSTTDGVKLPQNTSCASATAEGQICWDSDNDTLYAGTGAAATALGSGGVDATSQRVSMLNASIGYDANGAVYPEPVAINFGPANFGRVMVQTFTNTATEDCMWGQFSVPTDYSANPSIVVIWSTATGNTANVADFEFKYKYITGNDTSLFGQATETPLNPATFADPSDATASDGNRMVSDLGAPSTGVAADATMLWGFCRDGADGDTIADEIHVYDLLFEYDSTLNE